MTKIVLKTRITERIRTVIMTQSSTVDLRNSFIVVTIQKKKKKTWWVDNKNKINKNKNNK